MTTAIDQWAKQQTNSGSGNDDGSPTVGEGEITGDEVLGDAREDGTTDSHGYGNNATNSDDQALLAKKAKDKKIFTIAGIGIGVLAIGFVGFLFISRSNDGNQAQQSAGQKPPMAQVSPLPKEQTIVLAPLVEAPVQAIDLSPTQNGPVVSTAEPSLVNPSANDSSQPIKPNGLKVAHVTEPLKSTSVTGQPGQGPLGSPTGLSNVQTKPLNAIETPKDSTALNEREMAKLRSDILQLKKEIVNKDIEIKNLQKDIATANSKLAPRPAASVIARKNPVQSIVNEKTDLSEKAKTLAAAKRQVVNTTPQKKETVITASESKSTSPSITPSAKDGKVRNEYSVYAISNGRAWVTWSDGINYTVSTNSELPDSSRVTKIDDVAGVVFTTKGEIHPKASTK